MTAQLSPVPVAKFFSNDGFPLSFGQLFSYIAGTTTPQATYVDSTQTTQNANPIQLNFRGECNLWLDPTKTYKFLLQDLFGNIIPGWPVDNIPGGFGALPIGTSLIPNPTNTFTLGNAIFSWANVYVGANNAPVLDTVSGNIGYFARTSAEIAAVVTPTNFSYMPGHILRYGSNTVPGTTDMSSAFTNALASNSQVYLPGSLGPYFFNNAAAFNMTAGQTIYGDGPSTLLKFSSFGTNNIQLNNIVGAVVRDLAIQVTGSGANAYTGAVAIIGGSSFCKVERVSVSGVCGCGMIINASTYNTIRKCSFSNFNLVNANDSTADIYLIATVSQGANYNTIEDNDCNGGNFYGITILSAGNVSQPPTSIQVPSTRNKVVNNRVGQHLAYGILNYAGGGTIDHFNYFSGNTVENIQGAPSVIGGNAGAGIYSVGSGGDIFSGNTSINCCVQTTGVSLVPAGLAISGVVNGAVTSLGTLTGGSGYTNGTYNGVALTGGSGQIAAANITVSGGAVTSVLMSSFGQNYVAGDVLSAPAASIGGTGSGWSIALASVSLMTPVEVNGHTSSGMTRGSGIYITGCNAGVTINGGVAIQPGANNTGFGLQLVNCSNVTVNGLVVNSLTAQTAILMQAASVNCSKIIVNGCTVTHGGGGHGIQSIFNASLGFSQCVINNNVILTGASGINLFLSNFAQSSISNNQCQTTGNASLELVTSTTTRMIGNTLVASGTAAFVTSGACTGSFFDESNYLTSGGSGPGLAAVNNAGTGCNVRQLGTAVPAAGTQVLGDAVYNTAGVTPFAWSCTTAGTPGTFTGLTLP